MLEQHLDAAIRLAGVQQLLREAERVAARFE